MGQNPGWPDSKAAKMGRQDPLKACSYQSSNTSLKESLFRGLLQGRERLEAANMTMSVGALSLAHVNTRFGMITLKPILGAHNVVAMREAIIK